MQEALESHEVKPQSSSMPNPDSAKDSVKIKIKASRVNFYYGNRKALEDVSLSISEKKVTALIGPSGCGKSTFLRLLNRMNDLVPSHRVEGEILLDDQNIYSKSTDVVALRRRVGMVFQKSTPFPKSIYENLAYALRVTGFKEKKRLDEIVEQSLKHGALWEEVKDRLHQSALSLSGGQQQRLCIARALAVGPEVLLMDEPCSALDPTATAKIEELIFELKKDYTIVIVTHNMQQAARVSDETGFLFMGKLIEFGDTKKIFTKPEKFMTESYITGRFG